MYWFLKNISYSFGIVDSFYWVFVVNYCQFIGRALVGFGQGFEGLFYQQVVVILFLIVIKQGYRFLAGGVGVVFNDYYLVFVFFICYMYEVSVCLDEIFGFVFEQFVQCIWVYNRVEVVIMFDDVFLVQVEKKRDYRVDGSVQGFSILMVFWFKLFGVEQLGFYVLCFFFFLWVRYGF